MKILKDKFNNLPRKITNSIGSFASIVIHTILFVGIFALRFWAVSFSDILLILTTAVSLEAIYLSIFIQISVNKQMEDLKSVSMGIDKINEDVEEIQESVENIEENVE
jgi:low affinity Fe/Cu permease